MNVRATPLGWAIVRSAQNSKPGWPSMVQGAVVIEGRLTRDETKTFRVGTEGRVESCNSQTGADAFQKIRRIRARKEGAMVRLEAFQTAAREGGFVKVRGEGNVLWFRKRTADTTTQTHQRMCIDGLTNSVTVYWMTAPGKVNSKTFRAVLALQEWFKLTQGVIVQR
jgi:hypothetical protein